VLAVLFFWSFAELPDFGHYRGPYGFVLNRVAVPERHSDNVVNAVVYDYRGVDTLGEEFLLFAAATGVMLLLRRAGREGSDEDRGRVRNDAIRVTGSRLVGMCLLVGLWLVAFGFVTPGGGFQGGVATASGAVLLYVAAGYRAWQAFGDERRLDPLEAAGAGGYVIVGLAALVSGMPFLANLLGFGSAGTLLSGGSALLLNWAAGLEVAAANLVLYAEFLEEYVVPLGGGRPA
jgi:multicomponent Na+:H+ antiporter subunit B